MDSLRHGAATTQRKGGRRKKKWPHAELRKRIFPSYIFFSYVVVVVFIFDGKDERFFGGRNNDNDVDCLFFIYKSLQWW
jgi:hypothetical protein